MRKGGGVQSSKEAVLEAIDSVTANYGIGDAQYAQASYIAGRVHVSRSLASQYMNALHDEGVLIKVATRPALFFSRSVLERGYSIRFEETTFLSLEELSSQINHLRARRYNFEDIIGANGSCKAVVEALKAASCYPPHGLPFLLGGNKGTGKALMREASVRWCLSEGIIASELDCVTLDAAEQRSADLIKALFGSDEGEDGFLRSNRTRLVWIINSQELGDAAWQHLLSYFDTTEGSASAPTSRLFFECCGAPNDAVPAFVQSAIPIVCHMPDFADRDPRERESYVVRTFQDEAAHIGKTVLISSAVVRRLSSRTFSDNIIGLTRAVRLACANALAHSDQAEGEALRVFLSHVPSSPDDSLADAGVYEEVPVFVDVAQYDPYAQSREPLRLLSKFIETLSNGSSLSVDDSADAHTKSALSAYLEYMAHHRDDSASARVQESAAADVIRGIFEYNGMNEPVNFTNHLVGCLAFSRANRVAVLEWGESIRKDLTAALRIVKQRYSKQYQVLVQLSRSLQDSFGWRIDEGDMVAFTFYLYWYAGERRTSCLGIIVAHGYSTASSIADSVNTMLGNHVFDAVDMPLEVPNEEVIQALQNHLSKAPVNLDLLIMVDMGSLEEIGERLNLSFNIDIGVINNVSTATALEAGAAMLQHRPLADILESVAESSRCSYTIEVHRAVRDCIVFTSENGVAAASRLADLFVKSLPESIDVDIVTCDYFSLVDAEEYPDELKDRNVLFLFGATDPHIRGMRFVSLEDIVGLTSQSDVGIDLDGYLTPVQFEEFKRNLVRTFSVENLMRHLTILEPTRLMDAVSQSIEILQTGLSTHFTYRTTMRLYIHMSYLVERLVTKDALEYPMADVFEREHERFVELVHSSFANISRDYGVEVPIGEIIYLYELISLDSDVRVITSSDEGSENSTKELGDELEAK